MVGKFYLAFPTVCLRLVRAATISGFDSNSNAVLQRSWPKPGAAGAISALAQGCRQNVPMTARAAARSSVARIVRETGTALQDLHAAGRSLGTRPVPRLLAIGC
jgi:hypothetical protein